MRACVCVSALQVLGHGRLRAAVSAGPHMVLWSFLHKRGFHRDGLPLHHIQHLSRNVYLHLPLPPPEKSTCFWLVCPAESAYSVKVKICSKVLKCNACEHPAVSAHAGPQRVQQVFPPHVLLRWAACRELARFCEDLHHTDQCPLLFWYSGREAASLLRCPEGPRLCRQKVKRHR